MASVFTKYLRHKYRREGNMEREAETGGGGGGE
jgi:hypothetical protein